MQYRNNDVHQNGMRLKDGKEIVRNLPLLALLLLTATLIFSRCANQGMPTGGPKDTIPPLLTDMTPPLRGLNYTGKDVRITFNEYIVPDAVSEELVISPPLEKRPVIRTKSKTLIVGFNEELKPDVTYSLDFKNSVTDNNENNPYMGLRLLFSTGSRLDTLRVAGMVKNATNLDPQEKMWVLLYSNSNDTAVYRTKPDYISRTDSRGIFLFDNVRKGNYRLYALNDANNNLLYEPGVEEFAFSDTLVSPSAEYIAEPDTLAAGADSLLIAGHTLFHPDPLYLRLFQEDVFEQYVDKSFRESRHKCLISFGESVKDTFNIRLLNEEAKNWYSLEFNPEVDSLTIWLTDTLIARYDTLKLELSYAQLDSLKKRFIARDTIQMIYTEKEKQEVRKKRKEEEAPEVVQFYLNSNLKASGFDLNNPILLTSPEPVKSFDPGKIRLRKADDVKATPLKIKVEKDTSVWRTYRIAYPWEPNTEYVLEVDSTAFENIYGITSMKMKQNFTTQKDDYYGRIILDINAVSTPLLIELLNNSKEEKVLKTLKISKDGKVIFDFLSPEKYRVRIIFDKNNNGKWDTGDFKTKTQPERVAYLPEIVKVRSNWDNQFSWNLKPDPTYKKVLFDKEEEELRLKKLKEEKLKEAEKEKNAPVESPEGVFGNPLRR